MLIRFRVLIIVESDTIKDFNVHKDIEDSIVNLIETKYQESLSYEIVNLDPHEGEELMEGFHEDN